MKTAPTQTEMDERQQLNSPGFGATARRARAPHSRYHHQGQACGRPTFSVCRKQIGSTGCNGGAFLPHSCKH